MPDETTSTRWRGGLKNALSWGVVWGALGTAVATAMRISDNIPFPWSLLDGIGMGIKFGVIGGIAGAAFSTFIILAYRGKRLADISWKKFGLGGFVLAGLFVPAFLQTMNVLTGGDLVPWHLIFDDTIFAALFGGITAAAMMKLAQRHEAAHPVTVEQLLDRMEQSIGAGGPAEYLKTERTRSAEPR